MGITDVHFSVSIWESPSRLRRPPQMIGDGLDPWQEFRASLRFSLLCQLFCCSFRHMTNIKLMVYVGVLLLHGSCNLNMSVSRNLFDVQA